MCSGDDREDRVMYQIDSGELKGLVEYLRVSHRLYGPVSETHTHQVLFRELAAREEPDWKAEIPINPIKQVVFPHIDAFLRYRYERKSREVSIGLSDPSEAKALLGVRSCDLEGLLCLDRFFLGQEFVDEMYRRHRRRLFIVSNTCVRPFSQCFCVCTDSGPAPREGFDLNLIALQDGWLVEVGSERGETVARELGWKEAPAEASDWKQSIVDASVRSFDGLAVENKAWISRVTNRITTGFVREGTWDFIGKQCLECGACSFVCPSCSCFNVEDVAEMGSDDWVRLRCWDSCAYEGYTRMAGDHNPRKPVEDRRNKRFFCKLSYSQAKKYLRPGCVGCGRCSWVCPGDIGLPNVVTYIRREIEEDAE